MASCNRRRLRFGRLCLKAAERPAGGTRAEGYARAALPARPSLSPRPASRILRENPRACGAPSSRIPPAGRSAAWRREGVALARIGRALRALAASPATTFPSWSCLVLSCGGYADGDLVTFGEAQAFGGVAAGLGDFQAAAGADDGEEVAGAGVAVGAAQAGERAAGHADFEV